MSEEHRSWWLPAVAVLLFSIVFLSIIFVALEAVLRALMSDQPPELTTSPLEIVGLAINTILTIGLLFIYTQIRTIQADQEQWMESQTKIQDRQADLMEAQYTPLLTCTPSHAVGDGLVFDATNDGEGIAQKIDIELQIFVANANIDSHTPLRAAENKEVQPVNTIVDHQKIRSESKKQLSEDDQQDIIYSARAGPCRYGPDCNNESPPVIEPHNSETLITNLGIQFEGGLAPQIHPETNSDFESGTAELAKHGYDIIGYKIVYSYSNILDDTVEEKKQLASGVAKLKGGESFQKIFEHSEGRIATLDIPVFGVGREYRVHFPPD